MMITKKYRIIHITRIYKFTTVAAQHFVQVTPLARPVTRGVFGMHPVPLAVPISKAARGAPDAERWATALFDHYALLY